MGIFDKIEEVRHQPEHIRLRWAWGFTIVAMVVVLMIWMISFSTQRSENNKEDLSNNEIIQELGSQKDEIQNSVGEIKNSVNTSMQSNLIN